MTTDAGIPTALLDLDGVVWRGDEAIAGAAGAIDRLCAGGWRVGYFTNNSYPRRAAHLDKLRRLGAHADDGDVLTSADSAARLCRGARRALVLGGPGIEEALAGVGVEAIALTDELVGDRSATEDVDVVVVGIDPHCTYGRLAVAASAVRAGARFVATNTDATFPTPGGLVPGAGALVAAVQVACGVAPVVAGKPEEAAAALVRARLGVVSVVVGDRPETDGRLAQRLGAPFGLVLSGVTPPGHGPLEVVAELEGADLAHLVEMLGEPPSR